MIGDYLLGFIMTGIDSIATCQLSPLVLRHYRFKIAPQLTKDAQGLAGQGLTTDGEYFKSMRYFLPNAAKSNSMPNGIFSCSVRFSYSKLISSQPDIVGKRASIWF